MFGDVGQIDLLAFLIGGVLYMIYGAIYYSILLSDKKETQSKGPLKYVVSVIIAFVSSFFIGTLVYSSGIQNWLGGLGLGFVIGLIISLVYLKNTLFGLISKKSFLVAIGDHLVIFTLLGLLHGLMV